MCDTVPSVFSQFLLADNIAENLSILIYRQYLKHAYDLVSNYIDSCAGFKISEFSYLCNRSNYKLMQILDIKPINDSDRKSGLTSAIRNEDLETIKYLIDQGSIIEPTHLITAGNVGNYKIIKYISKHTNMDIISYIAATTNPKILLFAIGRCKNVSLLENTCIPSVARYGTLKNMKLLIKLGMQISPRVLVEAIFANDIKKIKYLIKINAPISPTAISISANYGNLEILKLLWGYALSQHLDMNLLSGNAITAASSNGHIKVVEFLLDQGVPRHAESIINASYGGYNDIIILLLNNNYTIPGHSIFAAASGGHTSTIQLLLQYGAPLPVDCLSYAVINKHHETINLLISLGLRPTNIDLANACLNGDYTIACNFIENHGARITSLAISNAKKSGNKILIESLEGYYYQ